MDVFRTNIDEGDHLPNKILRMCRRFTSTLIQLQFGHVNLDKIVSCKDVDKLLNFAIKLTGGQAFRKSRSAANLYHPIPMYHESFYYWHRVLRKLNFLERQCGGCLAIAETVTSLLRILQKGLTAVYTGKFLCCQRKRSYLDAVYYPGKYLIKI